MKADLHSHTIYSDGSLTVDELMTRAIEHGLDVFAITDHDCLDGALEAYNKHTSLHMVYGVEVSTKANNESVHILGYFKKPLEDGNLIMTLEQHRKNRKIRANRILDLLEEKFLIKLDRSFIDLKQGVTRGTIGDEIIRQGYPYTKQEIFEKMIGKDCPCYIPSTQLSTHKGISLIHESNGIAILAHPCLLKNNNVEDIIRMGVDGLEAVYPRKNNSEDVYRGLAKKYNLLVTAGSDFHHLNDYGHGDVGECFIEGKDVERFLQVLENEH